MALELRHGQAALRKSRRASGQPVDGIWFSGADMTRACFDVFKEIGKPLVPMTGEANNGFLRA